MQQKRGPAVPNRDDEYEERFNLFLRKIRSYQNEEVQKIQEKGKDQIQFEVNKIHSQSQEQDSEHFGKKQKSFEVETKIKKSRKINEARLTKMKTRFEMIEKIQNEIRHTLMQRTSKDTQYKQLLKKLIIQGMIKMLEQSVQIKCLARDLNLVKEILPECQRYFGDICEVKTKLVLNNERLPESDLGGIILTSFNGKIVCNNTLKARLDYAVQQSLPQVRRNLFSSESGNKKNQNLI